MLRYMNRGLRSGPNPHPVGVARHNWEFLAVVRGSLRPVFPHHAALPFQSRRLWLFPPESAHSWTTPPGENALIFVFHFASIHPLLEAALRSGRTLAIALNAADVLFLSSLNRELSPHYESPRLASGVHFESAMLRLCALLLDRDRPSGAAFTSTPFANQICMFDLWSLIGFFVYHGVGW